MDVIDYNWTLEEREAEQYRHFVLLGSKGMTQAYPTAALKHPEQFYAREEALAHANLAAKAPEMLRLFARLRSPLRF